MKEIGQRADVTDEAGNLLLDFAVTQIEVNPQCTSPFEQAPEHGNYLALSLDVTTASDWDPAESPVFFDSSSWTVIGPDGTTENSSIGNGWSCLGEAVSLPGQIDPGQHLEGKVVLDTAYTSGVVILRLPGQTSGGWEWTYSS